MSPSVCSASIWYCSEDDPSSGFRAKIFWIFFRASTLRNASLLRMLEMVIVISSEALPFEWSSVVVVALVALDSADDSA